MIVVDVETGGINPQKNPLLSIGAVEFENSDNEFYIAIAPWPGLEVTEEALSINGIDIEKWKSETSLQVAMNYFWHWVDKIPDKMLAGQNPSFDRDFINVNFERAGIKSPFGYRTIDIHSVAYAMFSRQGVRFDKLGMDQIYKLLGMEMEPKPHNALIGARMERKALDHLIYW